MATTKAVATATDNSPIARFKNALSSDSVQAQFKNALGESAQLFTASLIDIVSSDAIIQKSDPKTIIIEALKAATLKLPINKGLGYAWIVPYKGKATMQIGYRGYVQLAQRTGYYKYLNADSVYEGEIVEIDRLTGEAIISGNKKSDKAIGFFAFFELLNGFRKSVFWTREQVEAHAKRFSQSFNASVSPWKTDFDEMAKKTLLKHVLSKYGLLSVEMINAVTNDPDPEREACDEINRNANQETIDIKPEDAPASGEMTDEEKAEIQAEEQARAKAEMEGPDF